MSIDWINGAQRREGSDRDSEVTPEAFKSLFRRHPAGVTVITLVHEGELRGFTATSVISVSPDPPVIAFSIDSASSSWPALAEVDTVAISFLAASQPEISSRFATSGIDRFVCGGWTRLRTGEPVIDEAAAWLRGRVVQRTPIGSSYLVAVHALESGQREDVPPLVYQDRGYHQIDDTTVI